MRGDAAPRRRPEATGAHALTALSVDIREVLATEKRAPGKGGGARAYQRPHPHDCERGGGGGGRRKSAKGGTKSKASTEARDTTKHEPAAEAGKKGKEAGGGGRVESRKTCGVCGATFPSKNKLMAHVHGHYGGGAEAGGRRVAVSEGS